MPPGTSINLMLTIIIHFMALYGHQLGYCYSIIFQKKNPDTSHSDSGSSDPLVNEHSEIIDPLVKSPPKFGGDLPTPFSRAEPPRPRTWNRPPHWATSRSNQQAEG